MRISVEPSGQHTILHLRGEFDTFYCTLLEQEVQKVLDKDAGNVILNLRMVKYINSTALGSILKASKVVSKAGHKLVLSHPSNFCKDVLSKVGLDRIVPVFENDEAASQSFDDPADTSETKATGAELELDPASVIFKPLDSSRIDSFLEKARADNPVHGHAFGKKWSGIGRMAGLSPQAMSFTWAGGNTGLSPFEMGQLLSVGTGFTVKFRLPLLQKGFCEAQVKVTAMEERSGTVKATCEFEEINRETESAISQYAQDLDFLRQELRKATE